MKLAHKVLNIFEEEVISGTINKFDGGWNLSFDGYDRDKTFNDEEIQSLLRKYLTSDNERDFAEDGEKYNFKASVLDVMPSNIDSIAENMSQVGVYSAIEKRIASIGKMIDLRSKMSAEAKSEQSWKEKDSAYKSELSDLKGMLSKYKKWYDAV